MKFDGLSYVYFNGIDLKIRMLYADVFPGGSYVNSSPSRAAYTRKWIGTALVQIMACRLFGAKPFSKPLLGSCQSDT